MPFFLAYSIQFMHDYFPTATQIHNYHKYPSSNTHVSLNSVENQDRPSVFLSVVIVPIGSLIASPEEEEEEEEDTI